MMTIDHPIRRQWATLVVAVLAIFTDSVISSLIVPILPAYIGHGADQSVMGLLVATYAGAVVLATPLFGWLIDRIGNRIPLVAGMALLAMATVLFGASVGSLPMLFAARLLQGLACAATAMASMALIASCFPPEKRGRAFGAWTAANAAGTLIGPVLGGWLYELAGHWGPVAFAGTLAVIDGIARVFLTDPDGAPTKQTPVLSFLRNPAVLDVCIVTAVVGGGLTMLEASLPLFLQRSFSANPVVIGAFFVVAAVSFGALSPVAGALENRMSGMGLARIGLFGMAATLPLLSLAPNIYLAGLSVALVGASAGLTITPAMTRLTNLVDEIGGTSYGFATGLFNLSFAGGAALGPLVGAVTLESGGMAVGFVSMALVTALSLLVVSVRDRRRGVEAQSPQCVQGTPGV